MWTSEDRKKIASLVLETMNSVYGNTSFTEKSAMFWVQFVEDHLSPGEVISAINEYISSSKGVYPPKPADLIQIANGNGSEEEEKKKKESLFPTPDMAWALVQRAFDEDDTLIWTDEMRLAYGQIYQMPDSQSSKRRAFVDFYQRLVAESVAQGKTPKWEVSLGHNPQLRVQRVQEAVRDGYLKAENLSDEVRALLEPPKPMRGPVSALLDHMMGQPVNPEDLRGPQDEQLSDDREPVRDANPETRNWAAYTTEETVQFLKDFLVRQNREAEERKKQEALLSRQQREKEILERRARNQAAVDELRRRYPEEFSGVH